MILNSDGEQLLARVAPALDALAIAIDATTGEADLLRLRLNVPPLFASQRLARPTCCACASTSRRFLRRSA